MVRPRPARDAGAGDYRGGRELLGWRSPRAGNTATAEAALTEVLTARFGVLQRVRRTLLLRSANGLVVRFAVPHRNGPGVPADAEIHHPVHTAAKRSHRALPQLGQARVHLAPTVRVDRACTRGDRPAGSGTPTPSVRVRRSATGHPSLRLSENLCRKAGLNKL